MKLQSGTVDYGWPDFMALARDLRARQSLWRRWLIPTIVVVLAFIYAGVLQQPGVVVAITLCVMVIALVAASAVAPYTTASLMLLAYRRNPHRGPQYFSVEPNYLGIKAQHGETSLMWSGVDAVRRRNSRLLVYTTKRCAFILGPDSFANAADYEAFANAARLRWEEAHR